VQAHQVDYEVLPRVTEVVKAMQPGAPILHDDLVTESMPVPLRRNQRTSQASAIQLGESGKGFADAKIVIENRSTPPRA